MSDETSIVIDIGAPALTGLYAEHLVRNAFAGAVYPIWIIVTNRLDSHVSLPEADGLFLLPQSDNIGSAALVEVHSEDQLMQLAASMEQVAISRNSPLALTLNEVPNGGDPMEVPVVDIKLNPPTMPDPSSHIVPLKTVNGVSIIGYGDISLGTLAMGAMIKELIDDTAGLGNKGVTWSADKLSQEFAGKMDATTFKTVGGTVITGAGDIPLPTVPTFKTVNGASITGSGDIVTGTGDVTLNGVQTLTNKTITGLIETKVNIGTDNKIDVKTGNLFYKKLTAATTFDFINEPSTGVCSIILELENAGTFVTWPTAVKWAGGTQPSLTVTGIDILGFYTYDGGATWRGLVLAKDSK